MQTTSWYAPHRARRLRLLPASMLLGALATTLGTAASAQGDFVNYEVGPVHPITANTFEAGGAARRVVMVCNTAKNALEFYDSGTGSGLTLIKSIPTGLAPVTVVWDEGSGAAYTCDHIGDSVTKVSVTASAGSGGSVALDIRLVGTYRVGDEPCDLVMIPAGLGDGGSEAAMLVTLRSRSAVAEVDPATMRVRVGGERIVLSVPRATTPELIGYPVGVKNPGVMVSTAKELYVLDRQSDDIDAVIGSPPGSSTAPGSGIFDIEVNTSREDDLDLYVTSTQNSSTFRNPLRDPAAAEFQVSGLGTTHHDMVTANGGKYLLVVGMDAQASVADTEDALANLPTGFAQSWLWVMYASNGSGAAPIRRNENDGVRYPSINLNRDYSNWPALKEVAPNRTLSQPTGVAVMDNPNGSIGKVVITAFSSDRVAVLAPSAQPGGWEIHVLDLTPISVAAGGGGAYSMAGPRGVHVDSASQMAYVTCSLDNSVRSIDLSGATPVQVQALALDGDDTPAYVRAGREFLYGAKHSKTGTVSCASCHIDGHTDGIAWSLNPADDGPIPVGFDDTAGPDFANTNFPHMKGFMVTQSLRGLVNYQIDGPGQKLATNAPYHWRGDRASFQIFKKAFPDLLGGPVVSTANMDAFTKFINGVVHPPNPEQPLDRRLSGDLGPTPSPTRTYDPTEGSGMKQGLKIYHTHNVGGLSCNHCHSTPEGSGNRATNADSMLGFLTPIEPVALRNIFDFEPLVMLGSNYGPSVGTPDIDIVRVKTTGLFHEGGIETRPQSINHFMQTSFATGGRMPGASEHTPPGNVNGGVTGWDQGDATALAENALALTEFVRGLDSGTAPAIGWSYNFSTDLVANSDAWNFLYDQVQEANAGVVLYTRIGGVEKNYWFDITRGSAGLFRHDTASGPQVAVPGQFIAGVLASDTVVAQAVPVGSARRIADWNQLDQVDAGPPPSNVTLEPMAMATQWEDAGDLKAFWEVGAPLTHYSNGATVVPRRSHEMLMYLQDQLINLPASVPGAPFGIDSRKHEPPRRVRVSGDNIRPGAEIAIILTGDAGLGGAWYRVWLPIFPTSHTNPSTGARVWETAVELDAEMTLALLNGGPDRTGVKNLLEFGITDPFPPGVTDPANHNKYYWIIRNPDQTNSGWQNDPLSVQNMRW